MLNLRKRSYHLLCILLVISGVCFSKPPEPQPFPFKENPSQNFLIRWGFQSICDHVFDPFTKKHLWPTTRKPGGARFNPSQVKPGDVVFVRNVGRFFATMHHLIKHPYCILTHGERRDSCKEPYLDFLNDKKIIAWFSIHPCRSGHQKFIPLPLGIQQERSNYTNKDKISDLFLKLRTEKPKNKLLYLNFEDKQNPERKAVRALFGNKQYCTSRTTPVGFVEYLNEMAEHKFTLSPRGWGPDSYRTWEALYVGTIPIVRRGQAGELTFNNKSMPASQLDKLYEDLPIVVIDDWSEITEEFLLKKYEEMSSKKYAIEKLYLEYWHTLIKKVQLDFRQKGIYPNNKA